MNHSMTELQTIQKGGDSVVPRLKNIKDELTAAGEVVSDHGLVIATLSGLPKEFSIIKTVVLARETPISLKENRTQLLGAVVCLVGWSSSASTSTPQCALPPPSVS